MKLRQAQYTGQSLKEPLHVAMGKHSPGRIEAAVHVQKSPAQQCGTARLTNVLLNTVNQAIKHEGDGFVGLQQGSAHLPVHSPPRLHSSARVFLKISNV